MRRNQQNTPSWKVLCGVFLCDVRCDDAVWCDAWCDCVVQCGVVWRAFSLRVFILTIKRPLKLVWNHILIIGKSNVCTSRTNAILVKVVYDNRNWQDFYPLHFLEYFDKIDSDLKRGSEEEELLNAVKKRHAFGTCAHSIVFFCIVFCFFIKVFKRILYLWECDFSFEKFFLSLFHFAVSICFRDRIHS